MIEKNRKQLGRLLVKLREEKGLTRYELWQKTTRDGMPVHSKTLGDIEEGRKNYTIDSLLKYIYCAGIDLFKEELK
jgi:hypothetical protein